MPTKDSVLVRLPRGLVERWDRQRGEMSRAAHLSAALASQDIAQGRTLTLPQGAAIVAREVDKMRPPILARREVTPRFKGAK